VNYLSLRFSSHQILFSLLLFQVGVDLLHFCVISLPILALLLWGGVSLILPVYIVIFWRDLRFSGNWYSYVPLLLLGYYVFLTLLFTIHPSSAVHETTTQLGCALEQFGSPERGFMQTCFFGYPTRQYLLSILPTLLLGRTHFALNFGGSLYFLCGLLLFAGGVKRYLKDEPYGDLIIGILLTLPLHALFFTHFLLMYEQSLYPFGLTLSGVGIYLRYLKAPSSLLVILLGVVGVQLAYLYTPALAVIPLLLVVLTYHFCQKEQPFRGSLFMVIFLMIANVLISVSFREDVKILGGNNINYLAAVGQGLAVFFYGGEGYKVFSDFLGGIISLFLLFGYLLLPLRNFVLFSGWVGGTLLAAVLSKGFTFYMMPFRFHRSLVILPVIMGLGVAAFKESNLNKKTLLGFFLFSIIIGGAFHGRYLFSKAQFNHQIHLNTEEFARHLGLIKLISSKVKWRETSSLHTIFIEKPLFNEYASIADQLRYYLPGTKVSYIETCVLDGELALYFVRPSSECAERLSKNGLKLIGKYSFMKSSEGLLFY
jgi:hypothetical protein